MKRDERAGLMSRRVEYLASPELKGRAPGTEGDLIVGDFNAALDHPPMRALPSGGWSTVADLANGGWEPTRPDSRAVPVLWLPFPLLVQIDHVLVGPKLAGISSDTVDIPGSEHRAVVAEVARK